jgi:predicted RNA binding protein YcfA (HicA-like mRNA interferase family)
MSDFYFPCKYRRVVKALKKMGLDIKEQRNHTKAECIHNGKKTTIPRHMNRDVKSEIMNNIGNFIIEKDLDREKFKKLLR